jgi:hypothetical protein
MFMAAQTTFAQSKIGVAEEGMTRTVEGFNSNAIRSPGLAAWWAEARVLFPDEFVRHLDEAGRSQEGTPLLPEALSWYRWADGGAAPPRRTEKASEQ